MSRYIISKVTSSITFADLLPRYGRKLLLDKMVSLSLQTVSKYAHAAATSYLKLRTNISKDVNMHAVIEIFTPQVLYKTSCFKLYTLFVILFDVLTSVDRHVEVRCGLQKPQNIIHTI